MGCLFADNLKLISYATKTLRHEKPQKIITLIKTQQRTQRNPFIPYTFFLIFKQRTQRTLKFPLYLYSPYTLYLTFFTLTQTSSYRPYIRDNSTNTSFCFPICF